MNGYVLFNLGCAILSLLFFAQTGSYISLGCAAFSGAVAVYCWRD